MASLLVRVERALLDRIRARASGEQAELRRDELPHPELSYLDPAAVAFVVWLDGSCLRCGMTVHEPVIERGRLVGGDVQLHDHDLTPLLARLGCGVAAEVDAWSTHPRVLPPNDVDLLRYELGLAIDAPPKLVAEASVVAAEDAVDREILSEIWANPSSDAPRMIYADRLQQRSDPRGELIALQLARGASGRPTERERELVGKWGTACLRPLDRCIAACELVRGFPSRVIVDDAQMMPHVVRHPMWAVVEELQTRNQILLLHGTWLSLRSLRLEGSMLAYLASADREWPGIERVLGLYPTKRYRGLALADIGAWQRVGASPRWPALRTLSVDLDVTRLDTSATGSTIPGVILRSELGRRLAHLDLTITPNAPESFDPHLLFRELSRSTIQRVTVQAVFDDLLPFTVVYDRRPDTSYELTVQVPPCKPQALLLAVPWIEALGAGVDRIRVTFVPIPDRAHHLASERTLADRLRRSFTTVEVVEALVRPACPWAYHSLGVPSAVRP